MNPDGIARKTGHLHCDPIDLMGIDRYLVVFDIANASFMRIPRVFVCFYLTILHCRGLRLPRCQFLIGLLLPGSIASPIVSCYWDDAYLTRC